MLSLHRRGRRECSTIFREIINMYGRQRDYFQAPSDVVKISKKDVFFFTTRAGPGKMFDTFILTPARKRKLRR